MYVSFHQRVVIARRVEGDGEIEGQEIMIEGSKAFFVTNEVLAVPRHNCVPIPLKWCI